MTGVYTGRWTAQLDSEVAVFLIGMRFNTLWRVDRWWPVVTAMPRMLRHLEAHPESGLLGWHQWLGRTTILVSYWRGVEDILAFAKDSDAPHAAAWREFNTRIGKDGTVGIWHETYVVGPGRAETVYANMPAFGLAGATRHVPVTPATATARRRLGGPARGSEA
ncbi:MAG TPA: DUF4188 domain-containing protein [Pseudonocardiaceae bacterium]